MANRLENIWIIWMNGYAIDPCRFNISISAVLVIEIGTGNASGRTSIRPCEKRWINTWKKTFSLYPTAIIAWTQRMTCYFNIKNKIRRALLELGTERNDNFVAIIFFGNQPTHPWILIRLKSYSNFSLPFTEYDWASWRVSRLCFLVERTIILFSRLLAALLSSFVGRPGFWSLVSILRNCRSLVHSVHPGRFWRVLSLAAKREALLIVDR